MTPAADIWDAPLSATGPLSRAFAAEDVHAFGEACAWVKALPYGRNIDPADPHCVFSEGRGTCSTKHLLLQRLADELGLHGVSLWVGIFPMQARPPHPIHGLLQDAGLPYMPEAHCYLKVAGHVADFTFPAEPHLLGTEHILEERPFPADELLLHKVAFHRQFLRGWLAAHAQYPQTLEQAWALREACIHALSFTSIPS